MIPLIKKSSHRSTYNLEDGESVYYRLNQETSKVEVFISISDGSITEGYIWSVVRVSKYNFIKLLLLQLTVKKELRVLRKMKQDILDLTELEDKEI